MKKLPAFLEKYFPPLKGFYGYGKIEISTEDPFEKYFTKAVYNLNNILKNDDYRFRTASRYTNKIFPCPAEVMPFCL
jgi:hypothetical protein